MEFWSTLNGMTPVSNDTKGVLTIHAQAICSMIIFRNWTKTAMEYLIRSSEHSVGWIWIEI